MLSQALLGLEAPSTTAFQRIPMLSMGCCGAYILGSSIQSPEMGSQTARCKNWDNMSDLVKRMRPWRESITYRPQRLVLCGQKEEVGVKQNLASSSRKIRRPSIGSRRWSSQNQQWKPWSARMRC